MKAKLEQSSEYLRALNDAKRYKPEGNTEEVTGYTVYTGTSKADKTYPILFNFVISLLLQIIEKLNRLINFLDKPQPSHQTIDNDLDRIISGINKLSLGEEVKLKRKPIPYSHWVPRK